MHSVTSVGMAVVVVAVVVSATVVRLVVRQADCSKTPGETCAGPHFCMNAELRSTLLPYRPSGDAVARCVGPKGG